MARGAHRVILDPEGDSPPGMWRDDRRPGRGQGGREERLGKRGESSARWRRGAGEAAGAPQPTSPSPEPTPTDWGYELPPPQWYARQPARREPGTVRGWRAGVVAELVPLREVGREDERGTGEARDPPLLPTGQQGGEATRKGAGDGGGRVEEDAGRGPPGS